MMSADGISTLLLGASTNRGVHERLATPQGVRQAVNDPEFRDPNQRTLNGHALVAHLADTDAARDWAREAVRIVARVEGRRATDPAYAVTTEDVLGLWRAWGNFWRALNVCPYAWARFRWRMEDLLGAPRCSDERRAAGLSADGITAAENDASLPNTLPDGDYRKGGGGIGWLRHVDTSASPPSLWFTDRWLSWREPGYDTIVELNQDGQEIRSTREFRTGSFTGAWRRATLATILGWDGTRMLTLSSGAGANIFFGRPQDGGAYPPGVGGLARGFPSQSATLERLPTGENHRVWIFNDGTTFSQPGSDELRPVNDFFVPAPAGSFPSESVGGAGRSRLGEIDNRDLINPTRETIHRTRQIRVSEIASAFDPLGRHEAIVGQAPGEWVANLPYCPVTPPAVWYWEVLAAPVQELRISGIERDVSLLEYAVSVGPYGMARECLRDVVARNSLLMDEARLNSEASLFSHASMTERQALAQSAQPLADQAAEHRTITGVLSAATAVTAAIPTVGPVASVIVGAGALITTLALEASRQRDARSRIFVDVFGRLTPAWEQFSIKSNASDLRLLLAQPEMKPPGGVRRTADLVASLAEAAMGQMAPVQETFVDGAFSDAGGQTQRSTRTVVLYGLDPARGARVQTLGARTQDVTLAQQETGAPARWQTSTEYGPTWVFGVPADTAAIRVLYPDGAWRDLRVPALPEDGSANTPAARTAFLDATPPRSESVQGGGTAEEAHVFTSSGFPPRTVVLVGLTENARVYAQGDDITTTPMLNGDAARWIETTVAAGPARGWSFGVAAENVRALDIVNPDGTRRTVPLPAFPAGVTSVTDRVTVIDLRATGNPDAALYPSRTVVLVGMPEAARIMFQGRDITGAPMLTGDAARWIASTIGGVNGWAFGVPEGARVIEVVTAGGVRVPVTLPPMAASLPIRERVTTVDLRTSIPGASQAAAGGGGATMVGLAALAAGVLYFWRKKG